MPGTATHGDSASRLHGNSLLKSGHSMNVDQGTSPSVGSGVGNRKKSITLVSTVRAQTLNWRSAGIDVFIGEAMAEVNIRRKDPVKSGQKYETKKMK